MAEIINLDNTSQRLDELEGDIASFAKTVALSMKRKLLTLGLRERLALAQKLSRLRKVRSQEGKTSLVQEKELVANISARLNRKGGELLGPAWSFERHGIFLEHGVGRGRPAGSAGARAASRPWLEPTLDLATEILADILESKYADIVAGQLRILIPGVIDRTVITK
jgi:hypothetical protein